MKKHQIRILAFFVLYLLFETVPAKSFSLTPMSVSLRPHGPDSQHSFLVENKNAEKIAVQVSVAHRKMNPDGTEQNPPAAELFKLYPTHLILEPGEKRTLRLQWAGPQEVSQEQAFRLIAEQLPVNLDRKQDKGSAEIKMLLKYMGAVYVGPKDAVALLRVEKVRTTPTSQKSKQLQLEITIANTGNGHQVLKDPAIRVHLSGGQEWKPTPADLKALDGQNILAQSSRTFILALPATVRGQPLRAEIDLPR